MFFFLFNRYDEVRSVEFERSGGSTRSFDINVSLGNDIAYTFSSIEKGEYGRLYEFLKAKGIKLRTQGVGAGKSGLNWEEKKVDHHLAKVQNEAMEDFSGDDSMSSDDSDFNPDMLEALSAKEEYDSEPSTTSSEGDSSDGTEEGEAAHKRREERKKKRLEKQERKAKAAEKKDRSKSKGETKRKVKVKLPGQPKRNMSAYFIWMNENREKIKAANPSLSMTEIGKKSGEMWQAMTDKSEWEKRAAEDKKRYDAEMEKWKAEGGAEQLAAAKKQARKEKRLAKAGKSAKSGGESKPKKPSSAGPVDPKGGSGGGFKSKEFIEDSDSSDDNKKAGPSGSSKQAKKEEESSSDEVQKSPGPSGSGSASGSDSD